MSIAGIFNARIVVISCLADSGFRQNNVGGIINTLMRLLFKSLYLYCA